jgi:hypothetical protein
VFKKYANIVGDSEGSYVLYERDWTPAEWSEIQKAVHEPDGVDNRK